MATQCIDRTGTEEWELSSRGLCIYCGTDCHGCRARRCDSCTSMWLADIPAELEEDGPAKEYCPDCINSLCKQCGLSACHDVHDPFTSGAGKHAYDDGECVALVPIKLCMECHQPTTGSIGAAGYYWARLCQPCKDYADGYGRAQVQVHVAWVNGVIGFLA